MNTITCAVCGATMQTPGDVCAEVAAKGWEVMDGGARCKKCRMAGNSGKIREIPGNSRMTDAEIMRLDALANAASPGDTITIMLGREDILSLIAEVRAARAAGKD